MSDQQIIAYLQAIRRREVAVKRFAELTEIVNEVGKRMTEEQKNVAPGNPRVHHFNDFGRYGGFIESRGWPTADEIVKARQALASAVGEAQNLWEQIPQEERQGLLPPTAPQVHG